jgi:predicted PurR-regulated permease PerM
MYKEILNVFIYTVVGLLFLSIFLTMMIAFLPYYLGKYLVEFFENKKERLWNTKE